MSNPNVGPSSTGPTGPKSPQQIAAQKRLTETQSQVDEVVGIMRMNVHQILERDRKLSDLNNQAGNLAKGSSGLERRTRQLKRKLWLKRFGILGIIFLIIILIICDYYTSQWIVEGECLEQIIGFRWCYAGNSTNDTTTNFSKSESLTSTANLEASLLLTTLQTSTTTTTTAPSTPSTTTTPSTTYILTFASTSTSRPEILTSTFTSSSILTTTTSSSPSELVRTSTVIVPTTTSKLLEKMLKREHDVLDPAMEVKPVVNIDGQEIFSLHGVPLYRSVMEYDKNGLPK